MSVYNAHLTSENEYAEFLRFINEHGEISYDKLDLGFENEFRLFNVPEDEELSAIESRLDRIILVLPSIKRISSKPIIHLKDRHEVVPTEAVRVINNYTLSHAMRHSELWTKNENGDMNPQKLMTIEKTENYVIYENLVFCQALKVISDFLKKTSVMLKDILYGCRELNFNLLDRTQHNSYFLAIGKLRKGYSGINNQYSNAYDSCVKKILFINKSIRPSLTSKVYLKCKKHVKNLSLKKTNAFRSHKDYKAIYNLLKSFECSSEVSPKTQSTVREGYKEDYKSYLVLLSLFSVLNFNFSPKEKKSIDFKSLKEEFAFRGWTLVFECIEDASISALRFNFIKEKQYSICVLLCEKDDLSEFAFQNFKDSVSADEYLFASSDTYGVRDVLYLCIYDIDSFRRIQQILLRGMIYSDLSQTECAFCGNKTAKKEEGYECDFCRARIVRKVCEKTSKDYFISEIIRHNTSFEGSHTYAEGNSFLHDRCREAQLHFRNITDITPDASAICPHCGSVHVF